MENNKQQTAVEWYIEKLLDLDYEYAKGLITLGVWSERKNSLIQKAKEMERQRIENAFNSGYNNGGLDTCLTPKQYYEQTYGGGEQ
jgi:hypothetical protein